MMTDQEFKQAFAEHVKTLRKAAGLTQQQLGIMCGYPEATAWKAVQRWECLERLPYIDRLRPLAEALSCTVDDLIP